MASPPLGGWSSVFSALVSPELSLGVKLRLNATELRAANAIVEVMGQDGHSDEEISDVARALVTMQPSLVLVHLVSLNHFFCFPCFQFLYNEREDIRPAWHVFCAKYGTFGVNELRSSDAKKMISTLGGGLQPEKVRQPCLLAFP